MSLENGVASNELENVEEAEGETDDSSIVGGDDGENVVWGVPPTDDGSEVLPNPMSPFVRPPEPPVHRGPSTPPAIPVLQTPPPFVSLPPPTGLEPAGSLLSTPPPHAEPPLPMPDEFGEYEWFRPNDPPLVVVRSVDDCLLGGKMCAEELLYLLHCVDAWLGKLHACGGAHGGVRLEAIAFPLRSEQLPELICPTPPPACSAPPPPATPPAVRRPSGRVASLCGKRPRVGRRGGGESDEEEGERRLGAARDRFRAMEVALALLIHPLAPPPSWPSRQAAIAAIDAAAATHLTGGPEACEAVVDAMFALASGAPVARPASDPLALGARRMRARMRRLWDAGRAARPPA